MFCESQKRINSETIKHSVSSTCMICVHSDATAIVQKINLFFRRQRKGTRPRRPSKVWVWSGMRRFAIRLHSYESCRIPRALHRYRSFKNLTWALSQFQSGLCHRSEWWLGSFFFCLRATFDSPQPRHRVSQSENPVAGRSKLLEESMNIIWHMIYIYMQHILLYDEIYHISPPSPTVGESSNSPFGSSRSSSGYYGLVPEACMNWQRRESVEVCRAIERFGAGVCSVDYGRSCRQPTSDRLTGWSNS